MLIDFLKTAGAAVIGLGFIYFVIIRLCTNFNHLKKALVALIVGIVQTLIIVIAIILDGFNYPFDLTHLWYYAFLIISVLFMIIIPIIFLAIGKSRHQQFRNYHLKIKKQKEKVAPTIKDKDEYVYYVFKCKEHYLLKSKVVEGNKVYYSEQERLNKIIFHDEMINNLISKYQLNFFNKENVIGINQIGEVLVKAKKDKHFYCYLIEIEESVDTLNEYEMISAYDLFRYNMEDFDKQILFHMILKEKFKIEM